MSDGGGGGYCVCDDDGEHGSDNYTSFKLTRSRSDIQGGFVTDMIGQRVYSTTAQLTGFPSYYILFCRMFLSFTYNIFLINIFSIKYNIRHKKCTKTVHYQHCVILMIHKYHLATRSWTENFNVDAFLAIPLGLLSSSEWHIFVVFLYIKLTQAHFIVWYGNLIMNHKSRK